MKQQRDEFSLGFHYRKSLPDNKDEYSADAQFQYWSPFSILFRPVAIYIDVGQTTREVGTNTHPARSTGAWWTKPAFDRPLQS